VAQRGIAVRERQPRNAGRDVAIARLPSDHHAARGSDREPPRRDRKIVGAQHVHEQRPRGARRVAGLGRILQRGRYVERSLGASHRESDVEGMTRWFAADWRDAAIARRGSHRAARAARQVPGAAAQARARSTVTSWSWCCVPCTPAMIASTYSSGTRTWACESRRLTEPIRLLSPPIGPDSSARRSSAETPCFLPRLTNRRACAPSPAGAGVAIVSRLLRDDLS